MGRCEEMEAQRAGTDGNHRNIGVLQTTVAEVITQEKHQGEHMRMIVLGKQC